MGTSSGIEAPLPQKPAVASAPPSVVSDHRDGTERPADRRPRNPRKSRSISSSNEILGERPGSAPHGSSAGLPTSWPRDRQHATMMNYGMPYAFHFVENGGEGKLLKGNYYNASMYTYILKNVSQIRN